MSEKTKTKGHNFESKKVCVGGGGGGGGRGGTTIIVRDKSLWPNTVFL